MYHTWKGTKDEPTIEEIIRFQQGMGPMIEELNQLIRLHEKVDSPSLDRVIRIKAAQINPFYFTYSPYFDVPMIRQFVNHSGVAIGYISLGR